MVSRLVPILMVGLMLSACSSASAKESAGAGWRLPTTEEMMASCMPKAKKLMALLDAGVWFEANAKAIETLYSSQDERKQAYEYGFQIARGEINAELHEKLAKEYCQARVLEFIENLAATALPAFEEWEKSFGIALSATVLSIAPRPTWDGGRRSRVTDRISATLGNPPPRNRQSRLGWP